MKSNTIKTAHVYFDKQTETLSIKKTENEWCPINFQWIPILKLNNKLNVKTNKMKSIVILPIVLLVTLITSCTKDPISGSGELTSEFRNVANFTKVNSEGVFEVLITQGATQSVEIIGDDNIIPEVKTTVVDNELRLYLDDDHNYKDITLKVNITVPSITSIKNNGVGNISISGVDTIDNFNVYNSGTGDISIEGSAKSLTLKNEGTGKFEGFLFTVDDCNVTIVGSGDCEINSANTLNVRIEGSGDVHYIGSPIIEVDISGSGKIIKSN
jgi:hypothetical protein